MKKFVTFCLICVIFLLFCTPNLQVSATNGEEIEFIHNNRVFVYSLAKNIKTSGVYSIQNQLNKFNRFGNTQERKNLLIHMKNIGFDTEISINYIFPNINKLIDKISKNIYKPAQNAKLTINSNSNKVFHISKENVGIKVDKTQLYENLFNAYTNDLPLHLNIPTISINPQIKTTDYGKFTNLRADFSTNISNSSSDRKHNIKNALESINKIEIMPNQIFSFNTAVGKRTKENGYREAKIIVNNEYVEGVGGGVCQVSSTLYNAALLSGLEIIEANKHSKQVSYIKYGFDAMVNFGSSDLKFRNNTNEKLTIITNYSPATARIRIFGEDLKNVEYKLTNEIVSITEPSEEIIYDTNLEYSDKVNFDDEYFYLKRASRGMEIKSYREKFINGQSVEKELLRYDKFKVQNAVKVYGIKKRTETVRKFNLFDSLDIYN